MCDLCELIESGMSLRAVGRKCGVSATTVYRRLVASGDQVDRRRRRPVTPYDRRRIRHLAMSGEVSIRRIAAAVRRSWHTVRRVVGDELPRMAVPYRCPGCGHRVNLRPCVICHAQQSQPITKPPTS
jgi:lambda repressor-like predicted transcriptional regulator